MASGSSSIASNTVSGILRSPHFLLLLAMTFLSANFVVARGIHEQCPPALLSMWRWGGAALILLPFTWSGLRDGWPRIRERWVVLVSCAALMAAVGGQAAYFAMARTVAVNGAIIQSMIPVFIVLLSALLLIDRVNGKQALGLGTALVGVIGIITRGDPEILLGLRFNSGDLLLLLSGFGIAGYTVLVKRSPIEVPPLVFLAALCGVGALLHIPFVWIEMLQGSVMTVNTATLLSIVFVAIFPTVLAILFYNIGVAKLGPNKAGVYMYSLPVIAAALAYLFLGEKIAAFHVIGTIVIVAGIYVTVRGTSQPRPGSA